MPLRITPELAIDDAAIEERFVRASGPGGQHVNKVATAVELRFDVSRLHAVDDRFLDRLRSLAGNRLSEAGVIVIDARRYRTQARNREDARERLVALLRAAATPPRHRRPTRPTTAARRARVESKQRRSETKTGRRPVRVED
jgi:ribosome-associated protein